eukprot:2048435-Rhodomonas_salina.2
MAVRGDVSAMVFSLRTQRQRGQYPALHSAHGRLAAHSSRSGRQALDEPQCCKIFSAESGTEIGELAGRGSAWTGSPFCGRGSQKEF